MAMEKFHFKTSGGKTITLPRFGNLPAGMFRKVRKLEPADQMFTFLEELLDDDQLEIYDAMAQDEANEFAKQWQEDAGVSAGK